MCEFLRNGYSVRALKRAESSTAELESISKYFLNKDLSQFADQIEWVEGDVRDSELMSSALSGIDTVIHCAATVSFSKKDEARMNSINIDGTSNVVNACLMNNVRRLVHLSSTSALSKHTNKAMLDESCDYLLGEENSRYGISKFKAEMEVWRGIEEGLNAAILNPSIVLGYGDWEKGSCKLFKQYANGFPFYSTGSNAFVGVEDVARIIFLMANNDIKSERFLCVSENVSFKKVFDQMCDQFGTKPPWIRVNKVRSEIAWRIFAIINLFTNKPLITKESARSSVESRGYSNQKLCKALDFRFQSISDVIEQSVSAYQDNQPK